MSILIKMIVQSKPNMGRKFTDNKYTFYDNYILLEVKYKNEYIPSYIDLEDYEKVSNKHWRASHKKNKIYLCSGKSGDLDNPLIYIHNFIMNYQPIPQMEIDHIDGNSCNNRKSNLRLVSRQENIDNTKVRIDNQIGIRGVSQIKKTKLYKCDFSYHGQRFYFKDWKTLEEAVYCRKIAEEYFEIDTLKKNPLSQQYIDKLSEKSKQEIANYVYEKIS